MVLRTPKGLFRGEKKVTTNRRRRRKWRRRSWRRRKTSIMRKGERGKRGKHIELSLAGENSLATDRALMLLFRSLFLSENIMKKV
jgi:hypothetical protein